MALSILRTKLTDSEILKASLVDLGFPVKVGTEIRVSEGETKIVDIFAVLEGSSDLGWQINNDGSIDLVADLYGVIKRHNYTLLINSIGQKYFELNNFIW